MSEVKAVLSDPGRAAAVLAFCRPHLTLLPAPSYGVSDMDSSSLGGGWRLSRQGWRIAGFVVAGIIIAGIVVAGIVVAG